MLGNIRPRLGHRAAQGQVIGVTYNISNRVIQDDQESEQLGPRTGLLRSRGGPTTNSTQACMAILRLSEPTYSPSTPPQAFIQSALPS
eukprot:8685977-Pyramimonas_sp.AAC.1